MLPEKMAISVVDVLDFHQKQGRFYMPKRKFSAISLRLKTPGKYTFSGKSVTFSPGSICIIPEGLSYTRDASEEMILAIHFQMLDFVMEEIEIFKPRQMAPYLALFQKALELRNQNMAGNHHRICAVIYEIFAMMNQDFGFSSNQKDNRMIESAEYIRQNLSDSSLSVAKLAERACVSVALFRREFKRLYGTSPKQYLDSLRIQYAKTLLETNYFSQTEIALRCGFSDTAYFRTAFKNKTGQSITAYLKEPAEHDPFAMP